MKTDTLTQLLQLKARYISESNRCSDEARELRDYTAEEGRKYERLMGQSWGYYYAARDLDAVITKLKEQQAQPTE